MHKVYINPLHVREMQPIWRTKQNKFSLLGIEISSHVNKSYCSVLQIGCISTDVQGFYTCKVKLLNPSLVLMEHICMELIIQKKTKQKREKSTHTQNNNNNNNNWQNISCDWSCQPSQSASEKHDQERKAHMPLRPSWISFKKLKKMCLPCLLILQSCYFDYRTNTSFACSRCVICLSCDLDELRAESTHKSTRPENPIA